MKALKIIFLSCFVAITAYGSTITVSKQGKIKSIKQAISQAKPGDTLYITSGTYKEGNIIIEKSLTLIGENFPVLDGDHKVEIFTIHAHYVTISGLKFINTGIASINDLAAIKVLDSKWLRITNNRFVNTFFAIHFSNSSHSWIVGNQLQSDAKAEHQIGNGIHLWKCDHITVDNNIVKGHRDGIYFEFVTNSLITGNYSKGNMRYGLHFMFSHNNEYRNNTFVENGAGVAVMYTTGVKMINNTFEHNWGSSAYGLLLKDIRDSFVSGNRFLQNSVGILMEGSSRIQFDNNTFSENGYAIKLQASCDDNNFKRNNFSSNTFDLATNGSLVLNSVNGNYWDKYEGYDLNKDSVGDIPHHPVSMYSMVVEQMPAAVLLWRSFLVLLMDKAEKAIPVMTPQNLKDESPAMKPYDLNTKSQ
ncbi:nitrous oxide reductase family maturation protein NosD [Pseudochryseolinea flava]|uniref:Nitrous oxide reductase family maturation protein NosD n=1 Tax=Pseudochryseolinea flava TaxID=2059302 RepID=A0A364Y6G3_9BACT|nr:nitrous oxide reductase family maturation protein NosD [Pseudochryseolinea flava]RAW02557.1 nitrous oxide reductase family maturation protein NosD [Pseudochryseolinea flava]